jgi:polyphosphate kinase 2 (PPK2 family)
VRGWCKLMGVRPLSIFLACTCDVVGFKGPSADELNHDFLWRCEKALPGQGRIGIFNRSYYEEVLVTRVHPDILEAQHLPPGSPTLLCSSLC